MQKTWHTNDNTTRGSCSCDPQSDIQYTSKVTIMSTAQQRALPHGHFPAHGNKRKSNYSQQRVELASGSVNTVIPPRTVRKPECCNLQRSQLLALQSVRMKASSILSDSAAGWQRLQGSCFALIITSADVQRRPFAVLAHG